jgi:hypothetical protein
MWLVNSANVIPPWIVSLILVSVPNEHDQGGHRDARGPNDPKRWRHMQVSIRFAREVEEIRAKQRLRSCHFKFKLHDYSLYSLTTTAWNGKNIRPSRAIVLIALLSDFIVRESACVTRLND